MSSSEDLGLEEVHDLGLTLVADADGGEIIAYVTAGYWTCDKCKQTETVVSKVDRLLGRMLGEAQKLRFESDRAAVEQSKMAHASRCHPGQRPPT